MAVIADNQQSIRRNTYAAAPSLELTVIANGEEQTRIVDINGNIVRAGIEPPSVTPIAASGGAGSLETGKYYGYVYVYAATTNYPKVEAETAAGGSVAPRSNPSDPVIYLSSGATKSEITVQTTTRSDITEIWVYRTVAATTGSGALVLAEAGQLFYLGSVDNLLDGSTVVFTDTGTISVGEQIMLNNLLAPTFENVVYYHPYFYGIGNTNFESRVQLNADGTVEIIDATKVWYEGRSGQFIKFLGIDSGGIDGNGTYYFQWTSATEGYVSTDSDGNDQATFSLQGTTTATIYGLRATLFRSQAKNPFAWGETVEIGDAIAVRLWNLAIGAGAATALAVVPNYALLQIDTINPNKSYTLSLKVADSDTFAGTLKPISEQASATSNFCRFAGTMTDGNQVLMGLDCQQFAILQSDGTVQISAGAPVPELLKSMPKDLQTQLSFFGQYDPYHELNCFWFKTSSSPSEIDQLVFFHHPSGEWGAAKDYDLTATAVVTDDQTNEKLILGGTSTGFLGRVFSPNTHQNWSDATEVLYPIAAELQGARAQIITTDDSVSYKDGQYFIINSKTKKYVVMIEVDGSASPFPVVLGATDYIRASVPVDYLAVDLSNAIVDACDDIMDPHGEVSVTSAVAGLVIFDDLHIGEERNDFLDLDGAPDLSGSQFQDGGLELSFQTLFVTPAEDLVGRWLLVDYDVSLGKYLYARVRDTAEDGSWILCDRYYDPFDTSFSPAPVTITDGKAYIGGIHCRAIKFLDAEVNVNVKFFKEFWLQCGDVTDLHIGFHKNFNETPSQYLVPTQVSGIEGEEHYHIETGRIDGGPHRVFGISIDERGYDSFTIKSVTMMLNKD